MDVMEVESEAETADIACEGSVSGVVCGLLENVVANDADQRKQKEVSVLCNNHRQDGDDVQVRSPLSILFNSFLTANCFRDF